MALLFAALLAWACAASAAEAQPVAADPVLEARVARLAEELRCLVCQNQSLQDSHAPLAIDLKNQVRAMMAAGRSDAEVVDYMVARYGDFVRYRPPLNATTLLLWLGPLVLLLASLAALARHIGRLGRQAPEAVDADAERRAAALLGMPPPQKAP
jgi:cytochrome c-type biogenesis protein CcmH/NrfF